MCPNVDRISARVRRQFILGRQGLWPGRRWRGLKGLAAALRTVEAVQMDPVSVLCQSHDLVLWGRVLDYTPADLDRLLHEERRFFDYGAGLMIYPIDELSHWQLHMKRICREERWASFARSNSGLIDEIRKKLREEGPLRKRDIGGRQVGDYRGSKDSGVALYYLWLCGELMTHSRNGKERLYEFADRIAPETALQEAAEEQSEEYFARKAIALSGLINQRSFRNSWRGFIRRPVDAQESNARLATMAKAGEACALQLDGQKETHYVLASDMPLIMDLQRGRVPHDWQPLEVTTEQEVTFLSPLEYVSARGRAKVVFDYDYIWEIYKPAAKRQYGPYTLPVLFGDRLVARMDAKLERTRNRLRINGVWLEHWFEPTQQFREAFAKGLDRLMTFLEVDQVEGETWLP